MNLIGFDIYQFQLPLKKELKLKGNILNSRQGFVICLKSDSGAEGVAEVSPLVGFSQETHPQVLEELRRLKGALLDNELPHNLHRLEGRFEEWIGGYNLSASVRFGFEAAVLNLMSAAHQQGLHQFLSANFHNEIKIHALLKGDVVEIVRQAEELKSNGIMSFKLKVGEDLEEDIKKVLAVNNALQGQALLHVDANQQWDVGQALEFGKKVTCAAVEYVEEPFKNIDEIPRFFQETMIPVALDESLSQHPLEKLKSLEGVDFFVLKPTILGGVEKIWQMMSAAQTVAIDTIISSSFESGVGIYTLAQLAAAEGRFVSAGLDTLKYFSANLLQSGFQIEHGKIVLPQSTLSKKDLNWEYLEEVSR